MDNINKDMILFDLQRISELVHEDSDAVKWAIELMRITRDQYELLEEQ